MPEVLNALAQFASKTLAAEPVPPPPVLPVGSPGQKLNSSEHFAVEPVAQVAGSAFRPGLQVAGRTVQLVELSLR